MADQLLGVLREVVARRGRARPRPAEHAVHRRPPRRVPTGPDWRRLARAAGRRRRPGGRLSRHARRRPTPPSSPSCLRAAPERTVEVDLRLARALIEAGDLARAPTRSSTQIEANDPWEWRADWSAGVAELCPRPRRRPRSPRFRDVYTAVPGELAPKLALGVAAECGGRSRRARSRGTRPSRAPTASYTTAALRAGPLPRLRSATGPGRWRPTTRVAEQLEHLRRRADRAGSTASLAADNGGAGRSPTCAAADAALRGLQLEGRAARPRSPPSSSRRRSGAAGGSTPRRAPARAWPATRSTSATCAPGWRATTATSPAWRRRTTSASGSSTAPTHVRPRTWT